MKKADSNRSAEKAASRWRVWLGAAVALLAMIGFGFWATRRVPPPPVPVVSTTGFDPLIAAAISEARESAQRTPDSAEARGRLGMVLLAHEVRREARECFAQAQALAPTEPRWPYFLGLAQLGDQPLVAVTNLARAVQLFPEGELAPRLRLAAALLEVGKSEEAQAHYRQVQQHDPNSAPARLGLGRAAIARGALSEAGDHLTAASQDPCTRKAAHRLLISVNQQLGRTNQLPLLAKTLAGLPPDRPFPDPFLLAVQDLKTGESAWTDQGDDWIKEGKISEAIAILEKASKTYPNSDRAMFLLGRALLRKGDIGGGEAMLSRAIAIAPGSIEAQMQLGASRLKQGRAREAQSCFRAAIQAKPNLAEAWFNLGLSLGGEGGKRTESIAAFREAIRLKPSLAEAYLGLSVVLRAEGKNKEAVDELRRGLAATQEETARRRLSDQLKSFTGRE